MKTKTIWMSAIAGSLALTLAACGGPSSPSGSQPPAGGNETAATSAGWDIKETPREQLKEGGDFVGSMSSAITTWNTFNLTGNDAELVTLQAPIRPTYFDYTGAGDPVQNKDYLESFTTTTDGGKLVVSLKLNPAAIWNDGEQIDADDWIATWKAQNGTNKKFAAASTDGWNQVESVEAGAAKTDVVISFKSTYPDWTAIVGDGPLRAESIATPEDFNDGFKQYRDSDFSGPFKVTSWDKTSGTVVMDPNEKWWGAKPLLTKLTWKLIAPDALAAAFANGELDYYDIGADANGYQQASTAANSEVRQAAGPNFRHFTFNPGAANLSDVNVRQAIIMGLDRSVIAASDLAGLPGTPVPLNNNVYVSNQAGYVDQGKATGIDFNIEGAKQKLDEAGWTQAEGKEYREKDGKQLDVNFSVLGGVAASENEGLQAQKMLKEIGVNLKLVTVDVQKDWPAVLTERKFDIVAFSWIGTPYPLRNIGQIYGGTTAEDGTFQANESNYPKLDIPKVNELTPLIDAEMDAAKRSELGNQAAQAIWEAGHTLPLYQRPMLIGVRSDLANIGAMGMARVPKWENVGYLA